MKFGYVNLAVHNWNDELPVFILEENPTNLCPNKCYINCRMKIKRILDLAYVVNGYRCSFSLFLLPLISPSLFQNPLRSKSFLTLATEGHGLWP
jgi:hypothetical protein